MTFTAQVLYTAADGCDAEEVREFETEATAREWLADTDCSTDQTKELWNGRIQLEL